MWILLEDDYSQQKTCPKEDARATSTVHFARHKRSNPPRTSFSLALSPRGRKVGCPDQSLWDYGCISLMWNIWKEQNRRLFSSRKRTPQLVAMEIRSEADRWVTHY